MGTTPSYDDFFALIEKTELALNDFAQANSPELRDYSPTKVEDLALRILKNICKDSPFNPDKVYRNQKQHFGDIPKVCEVFLLFLSPWSMPQKKRLSMYSVSPPLPAQSNAALGTQCKDNIYLVIFKGHCRRM